MWQQQFMMPYNNFPPHYGNFAPNFALGTGYLPTAWGEEDREPSAAQGAPSRDRQQKGHVISEDEDDSPITAPPQPQQRGDLPEVEELLQEKLGEVKEADKLSPEASPQVAELLTKYLREAQHISEMEKLAKAYPRVKNVEIMRVQRLDEEVYSVVEQNFRTMDMSMQNIQKGVLGAMAAFTPALDLTMARKGDSEVRKLGKGVMDGLQLLAFTHNTLAAKRREMLRPQLAPVYAKVMTKTNDVESEWLYGGDLAETTKQAETAKKIGEKVMKRKIPFQPRAQPKRFKAPFPANFGPVMRPYTPAFQGFQQPLRFPNPQQGFFNPQMGQMGFPSGGGFGFNNYRGRPRYPKNKQGFQKRGAHK